MLFQLCNRKEPASSKKVELIIPLQNTLVISDINKIWGVIYQNYILSWIDPWALCNKELPDLCPWVLGSHL